MNVEHVIHGGKTHAIVIYGWTGANGVHFFTDPECAVQVGYLRHKQGKTIDAHYHVPVTHVISRTVEVLLVVRGRIRADFYSVGRRQADAGPQLIDSKVCEAGDVLILLAGGHGFEVLEEAEMWEVKSGPYAGEYEKVRFTPSPLPPTDGMGLDGGD